MTAPAPGGLVWSEAARALFALSGPTAVSAGAGSGKTTCLVELCMRLLSGEATGVPVDPGAIVAITFTEKAAAELEERLRGAVAARAAAASAATMGSREASTREASPGEGTSGVPTSGANPGKTRAEDGEGAARAWRLRLHALERMSIGTIHSFAAGLLRDHALEAGLDPDFQVLDEDGAGSLRAGAARGAVLAALDEGREEARALAAALGTGGLAGVVAELARERATHGDRSAPRPAPDLDAEAWRARELALGAARALLASAGRPRRREPSAAAGRAAATVGAALEAFAAAPAAISPAALRAASSLEAAARAWRTGRADEEAKAAREELLTACATFRACAADALASAQKQEVCALVADAEGRYAEGKRSGGALDFDDLLLQARDLLAGDAALRAELRERFRALLVDEYQDVNAVQGQLFELLAGAGEGGPAPLLVAVGDLKQSIYRFRGADVAVFRSVLEQIGSAPGGRVLHLAANHRSSPGVLEVVNEVSSLAMRPPLGGARPYELAFSDADRLVAVRSEGARPACEILEDDGGGDAATRRAREATALASRIRAIVAGAAGVQVRERRGAAERARAPRYGDVALLFRRLTQVAPYEQALREAGIPHRLARGCGFYQAPEVRELGELLASLAQPDDAIAWAALLRSPLCALGEGALLALARSGLAALATRPVEASIEELLRLHPGAARAVPEPDLPEALRGSTEVDRLRRFLGAWRVLRAAWGRLRLPDLLRRAADALDLEAAHLAACEGERRAGNLRKALALAERFERQGGGAAAFAARLRAMAARPAREPEAELEPGDAVALVSVHQAKGLEWPIVVLPDMGAAPPRDGRRARRTPDGAIAVAYHERGTGDHHATAALERARAEEQRAGAAESRRLLYVALTRARDRLVLSGEPGRSGESWRSLVEAGLAAHPGLAVRIPLAEAGRFAVTPSPGSIVSAGDGAAVDPGELEGEGGPGAEEGAASGASGTAAPPPPVAGLPELPAVRVQVTELAEHARCPRRVFLLRHLGLTEPGRGPVSQDDDPDRATDRGTLAHAMLSEVDLSATPLERRALLEAVASRRGHDPRARAVRRIVGDVTRFLDSAAGRRLADAARAGALRREVPFTLRLDPAGAPACYLVGALDAIVVRRAEIAVIDYKYAVGRPEAAARYRLQLLAYALAASRAFPGRRITAALQFLRGRCATVDLAFTPRDLRELGERIPPMAEALHRGAELLRAPEALSRDESRCRSEACGFVERCYAARAR